jgi:hypothetical protein
MNNNNNIIINSKPRIIKLANKLNNRYLFIRWPLKKSGLVYGIIKKDFEILKFDFTDKVTYIHFNYFNFTRPIVCELLAGGNLKHCLQQFDLALDKRRKQQERISTFCNNFTGTTYCPIERYSLSDKIEKQEAYDFYSPGIIIDNCKCLKCLLSQKQQEVLKI